MSKSWEKTVEWQFACEALKHLKIVAPIDGTKEISDLIAKLNIKNWVLVEFKANEESLKDEDVKYPEFHDLAMHGVLKDYFRFEDDYPSNIDNQHNDNKFKKFLAKFEVLEDVKAFLLAAKETVNNISKAEIYKSKPPKHRTTTVGNNIGRLIGFVDKNENENKNLIANIKLHGCALKERYGNRADSADKIEGRYADEASKVFRALPEREPHLLVFGRRDDKNSGEQTLHVMDYWNYKLSIDKRANKVTNLAGYWGFFRQFSGCNIKQFKMYLNALSFARGYLPNSDWSDDDKFGYFSVIGVYKRKGVVLTGTLSDIFKIMETITKDLDDRATDVETKAEKPSKLNELAESIRDFLTDLLGRGKKQNDKNVVIGFN